MHQFYHVPLCPRVSCLLVYHWWGGSFLQDQRARAVHGVRVTIARHGNEEGLEGFQVSRLHQCALAAGHEEREVLLGTEDHSENPASGGRCDALWG